MRGEIRHALKVIRYRVYQMTSVIPKYKPFAWNDLWAFHALVLLCVVLVPSSFGQVGSPFAAFENSVLEGTVIETTKGQRNHVRKFEVWMTKQHDRLATRTETKPSNFDSTLFTNSVARGEDELVFIYGIVGKQDRMDQAVLYWSRRIAHQKNVWDMPWPNGEDIHMIPFGELAGKVIFGGIIADEFVSSLLPSTQEKITAKSEYGDIEVWRSLENSGLPSKISLKLDSDHLLRGTLVSEIKHTGRGISFAGQLGRIEFLVDVVEFGKVGKQHYIKTWTVETKQFSVDDELLVSEIQVGEVSSFELNSPLDDRSLWKDLVIKDGHDVRVEGAEHLRYVWSKDEAWPMPKATGLSVDPQRPALNISFGYLALLGCTLLLIGGVVWLLWKRREQ